MKDKHCNKTNMALNVWLGDSVGASFPTPKEKVMGSIPSQGTTRKHPIDVPFSHQYPSRPLIKKKK